MHICILINASARLFLPTIISHLIATGGAIIWGTAIKQELMVYSVHIIVLYYTTALEYVYKLVREWYSVQ